MPYEFELITRLPASPQAVYDAWMSSEGHTAMTGGVAHVHPEVGGTFDAWDGYISGKFVILEPGKRIQQTWRTAHFDSQHEDSVVDIDLCADGDLTILTLTHSNVPDGQTSYEETGWQTHYFQPMLRRFEWLQLQSQI